MADIGEIASAKQGTIVLLYQHLVTSEVCGFLRESDSDRSRVKLSMFLYDPNPGSRSQNAVARALDDYLDPENIGGPTKWYRTSDFDGYAILQPSEEGRIQVRDLVVIPTRAQTGSSPHGYVSGYLTGINLREVTLSIPNPDNDSSVGDFLQSMRIGRGKHHESRYDQTKTYPAKSLDLSKARVLRTLRK